MDVRQQIKDLVARKYALQQREAEMEPGLKEAWRLYCEVLKRYQAVVEECIDVRETAARLALGLIDDDKTSVRAAERIRRWARLIRSGSFQRSVPLPEEPNTQRLREFDEMEGWDDPMEEPPPEPPRVMSSGVWISAIERASVSQATWVISPSLSEEEP